MIISQECIFPFTAVKPASEPYPYDPDFAYYTTGMGAFTGPYLTRQETWDEDTGNASYAAAMDCQELRLIAGDIELVITGDLSREESHDLAVQLQELAKSTP